MSKLKLSAILISLTLLATLIAGCSQLGVISGSGKIITQQYNFSQFTAIEVSSAFEIEITPSSTYAVSITTYENIFNYIDVSQSGNTLKIGMKPGSFTAANPKASVTLPALYNLSLSGASHGSAKGFKSSHDFNLIESGASSLDMDIETGNTKIDISGASKTTGQLKALDFGIQLSGASRADLTGSANNLTLDISGASQANMPNFPVQNASTHMSGASNASLTVSGKLDGDVSGASTLNYSGNPSQVKVSVTGASSLHPK